MDKTAQTNRPQWYIWTAIGVSAALLVAAVVLLVAAKNVEVTPADTTLGSMHSSQSERIEESLRTILAFNTDNPKTVDLDHAVLRDGSYTEEILTDGNWLAQFIVDIPQIRQSYGVAYYYLLPEQMQYYNYPTLASCLDESDLIWEDFDCKGDAQTAFIDRWQSTAEALSVEFGIPWEAVVAQGVIESASGTSYFAVNRNNFFGIAAFDDDPDQAYSFPTPEDGWRGYFDNIVHTRVYCQNGVFRGDTITDPYAYITALKAANYATDENYIESVSRVIRIIEARAAKKGWRTSAELAEQYPEMLLNAAQNAC